METKNLKKIEKWVGTYKGLNLEINQIHNKGLPEYFIKDNSTFTFYVYFPSYSINEDLFAKLSSMLKQEKYGINYNDSPLYNLDWHFGCTYGEAFYGENLVIRCLKFGCDYNHYWDEGIEYTLDRVLNDAKCTIDNFFDIYPDAFKKLEN